MNPGLKAREEWLSLIFKDKTQGRVNGDRGKLLTGRANKQMGNCLYQYSTYGQWD